MRYPAFLCTDSKIRVALLDSKGVNVKQLKEYQLAAGIIVNGEVRDVDKLASTLSQIANSLKLKERFVIVGISEIKATSRGLTIPVLPDEEVGQAIAHEISSVLPFSYTDEYLDWKIISSSKEEKRVFVSAIPRTIVDGFVAAFQKANLSPIAFETTALSLYRLIPQDGRKLCFAAELGSECNVLMLIIDGCIEACSVVSDPTSISNHLEKMIKYYVADEKKEIPQSIYLSGVRATEAVANEIKTKLKLNAILLKSPELAVLLSLARKSVKPPADPSSVNVLPEKLDETYREIARYTREHDIKMLVLIIMFIVTIAVGYTWFALYQATKALVTDGVSAKSASELSSYASSKLDLIKRTTNDNTALVNAIDAVLTKKPDGIIISGILYNKEKNEMLISGTAAIRENLLSYKQGLTDAKMFKTIMIPISALAKDANVEFRMRLTL